MISTNSLAFRLFATAAVWLGLVLPTAGFIIHALYRDEVQKQFNARISLLLELILRDSIDHGGASEPGAPKDTGELLFDIPESGWYWQIKPLDEKPGRQIHSNSLGQEPLPLPSSADLPPDNDEVRWGNFSGPKEQMIRVAEVVHMFGEEGEKRRYSVAVGGTLDEPLNSIARFRTRLVLALSLAGLGLLLATIFQVRFGLYPLRQVERGLAQIRSGDAQSLDGKLPAEIQPLQEELNALITSNHDIIERARTQVGNLAHALKTPLAVIANEAREDNSPLAQKVLEQTQIMRDQVQHYLDRARVAANTGGPGRATPLKPVAENICRALERIHKDRRLMLVVDCAETIKFQGEKQDLEEILGNLIDNAAKWAKSAVRVEAVEIEDGFGKSTKRWIDITIDDDGPGLTDEHLAAPVKRGRRLDETVPGSGLGHSIVADLVHDYRGTFSKTRSEDLGGFSARLKLPAA
jgi:signal transduction histidine kinase